MKPTWRWVVVSCASTLGPAAFLATFGCSSGGSGNSTPMDHDHAFEASTAESMDASVDSESTSTGTPTTTVAATAGTSATGASTTGASTTGASTTGASTTTSGPAGETHDTTQEGTDSSGSGEGPVIRPVYATLREAAAAAGKKIGAAVHEGALASDATFAQILAREFDYVTHENSAKWGPLMPTSTTYNWSNTDALVDFAGRNGQDVKGHTFLWHIQGPTWISESMSPNAINAAIQSHIRTTLDRYRGRMRAWDVVNEAVDISSSSGYTESVYFRVLGPEYIASAYRWAREADPEILLLYNEVGIERMGPKSDFAYQMLRDLLEQGVPIDGIGFQSHVSTHRYPSESDLRANIRRFAELGLTVNISEVDARTKLMPGTQEQRWHAERIAFQQIVGSCTVEPSCEAITFWGFSDNYSWINDDGPEDPLLYDRNNVAKPAYQGVMDGLAGMLPVRNANLLANPDFVSGPDAWSSSGGELTVGPAADHDGQAGCLTARTADTDGIVQDDLLDAVLAGGPMSFSAWVRVSTPSTVDASLLIDTMGAPQEEFNVASRNIESETWTELSGALGLGFEGTPVAVGLKIDGPPGGVDVCVTDVRLEPLTVD